MKVSVEKGVLTIFGERELEKEENKKYHRVERAYGRFVRTFIVPEDGDADKISAYRGGRQLTKLGQKELLDQFLNANFAI